MPRRKRKISGKRSLEFEESPVNIVRNVPSPVFCSDHPATADVVECDGVSAPWVSPQFVKVPTTIGRAKGTRRSKRVHTVKTHTFNSTTAVTPTHKNKRRSSSNIVPLKFLGDTIPTPPSPEEDISFDESVTVRPTRTVPTAETLRIKLKGTCENCAREKTDSCHLCAQEEQSMLDVDELLPRPLTTKTGRKPVRKKQKPPKLRLQDILTSDSDLSLLDEAPKARGHNKENDGIQSRNERTEPFDMDSDLENNTHMTSILLNNNNHNRTNHKNSPVMDLTQKIPKGDGQPKRTAKKLLFNNLLNEENGDPHSESDSNDGEDLNLINTNMLENVRGLRKLNNDDNVGDNSFGRLDVGEIAGNTSFGRQHSPIKDSRLCPNIAPNNNSKENGSKTTTTPTRFNLHNPNLNNNGNTTPTRLDLPQGAYSDLAYGSYVTPSRRRRSLRLLHTLLPGTPVNTPQRAMAYTVLVYDTPEEDYGLPVRKRRLKTLRRKSRSRSRVEQLKAL